MPIRLQDLVIDSIPGVLYSGLQGRLWLEHLLNEHLPPSKHKVRCFFYV